MNKGLQNYSQDTEIDLAELIKVIWAKKLWVIISTLVFTFVAGIYAFTAKERWTSTAEIIQPKLSDLGNYFEIRREYARINESEFNYANLANHLFGNFNLSAYSLDEREKFVKNSSLYQENTKDLDEKQKQVILSKIVNEDFSIVKPDPKKEPDLIGRKISFSATTAGDAQNTLKQFIDFVNTKVINKDVEDFSIGFQERIKDLEYEKSLIENNLAISKTVQLENLDKAYNIAEKAGIKEYSKVLDNNDINQALAVSDAKVPLSDSKLSDGSYLFMLGEKYLKAQIDVVNQDKLIYPPRYYQISQKLKELSLLFESLKKVNANAFSYLASPDQPITKDKPKRLLIILIGAVLGLIVGTLFILLKTIFRRIINLA